jgi:hypothetical protein
VTIFSVGAGGTLSGATFYPLPAGAINPISVAFSPNGAYIATANEYPNGVSFYVTTCSSMSPSPSPGPSSTPSSESNVGVIVGTTLGLGIPCLGFAALSAFLGYKYWQLKRHTDYTANIPLVGGSLGTTTL